MFVKNKQKMRTIDQSCVFFLLKQQALAERIMRGELDLEESFLSKS